MLRLLSLTGLAGAAALAAAQLESPTPSSIVGPRNLALSPDGSRLAFSYQGDIWLAQSSGGRATPITNHIEMDDNPIWSPDGNWIAFTSNRNGNWDIYLVPADGGQTKRLTWHTGSDIPSDWSPDGKHILIRTTRDDPNNGLYTIDVKTGRANQVLLDMMSIGSPRYSADGKSIIYRRFGFPDVRPRYEGSAAAQLWRYDIATGKRSKIRANRLQHLWHNPTPNGRILAVTVSDKTPSSSYLGKPIPKVVDNSNRTPNVYSIELNGSAKRLTDYVGAPVRYLTVARDSGLAAYERDGDLYLLAPNGQPKKVALHATIDDKTTQEERLILTDGASQSALSPKGDKFVFTVRGELWMVPTKKEGKSPNKDDATQLTDWPGTDEQPLWAPDNKTVFFVSDRDGSERLYKLDTETKAVSQVSKIDADVSQVQLTPDKTKVSYWQAGKDGGLYTVPVAGGAPTRVIERSGTTQFYDWSPDGRYVAYAETLLRSGYYYWESTQNLYVFDTKDGQTHNVTKLSAEHILPEWSPDGKYLFFRSNRSGSGIYALPLKEEDARPTELELKYEKPKDPVTVEIDFDGIENRPRRIVSQQPDSNILVDPTNGEIYFISAGDVWKSAYNGDDLKKITNGGGFSGLDFDAETKLLVTTKSGQPATINIRNNQNPVTTVAFRADWTRDLRKEREAAYNQFWRTYNRSFYDANFHGRDWVELRERYRKYLPSVGHRNEMATVLNMLIGELESSHSEVGAAPGNPGSQTSAHLGFTFDYSYAGPGIKVKEVHRRTPGFYDKTKLQPGDIVTKINGKDVSVDEDLYRDVLNEQVGRDLDLTVKGPDGKTRDLRYRAMSSGQFGGVVFDNRIEARRKYVEEKSGGKLTYVHIDGMGGGQFNTFNQQVWQYAEGKKGLIIDVRNNGGGNTSDRIIDVLERQPNSFYQTRDEQVHLGPGQALAMPMVVMHAETSFSNAEMFPYAMKARKLATLVGMETPGYVIYTNGGRLVDGTNIRIPHTGVYRLDGSPLENIGQRPDIEVDISPEDYFSGKDPQLDKAIEALMRQIK